MSLKNMLNEIMLFLSIIYIHNEYYLQPKLVNFTKVKFLLRNALVV